MVAQQSDAFIENLSSFVPPLILRRVAADTGSLGKPFAERYSAALLFADISGFTAMADQMAKKGRVGSEDVAALLNDYFCQFIEIVIEHGGEVVKFAGDAILAMWTVPSHLARLSAEAQESLTGMVRQAAQCGLQLQSAVASKTVREGKSLSLKTGLGAGDVYCVHLGGALGRWEFLLSGSPLVQMSLAKDLSDPGKVVLSPEAWELVKDSCDGRILPGQFFEVGSVNVPLPKETVKSPVLASERTKTLQSYVPAAVLAPLKAGLGDWLKELRRVSLLFISLPEYGTSITHPYARTLPEAQAVMASLQEALYRYAGSINKLNVDNKGITLVAAFGLAPLSHVDDPARAVHAALDMQAALRKLGRKSTFGITTGWVFCGQIGNERRQEYTVVGNAVNMASRLAEAAEAKMAAGGSASDVLCDVATYHSITDLIQRDHNLAGQLTFGKLTQIRVKGKRDPITVYRPRKRPIYDPLQAGSQQSRIKMVGRENEWSILSNNLDVLQQTKNHRSSKVIIIDGEAGIGKTVLLEQMLAQAEKKGISLLVGAGQRLDMNTPYLAWRPIFREIFQIDPFTSNITEQRAQVRTRLPFMPGERGYPALSLELSSLLNPVLPLGFPESALTRQMSPRIRKRTQHLFLLRLLSVSLIGGRKRQRRANLLVFEDGQWLDDASRKLILDISREIYRLLLVVVTRPLDPQAGLTDMHASRQLLDEPGVEKIHLTTFSHSEIHELICRRLGVNSVPAEIVALLHEKTGGHPYFCEEIVLAWKQQGRIQVTNREFVLSSAVRKLRILPAPESVYKMIAGQMDRLGSKRHLALKVASVIGLTFTAHELGKIYPLAKDRELIPKFLADLEELDFIRRDGRRIESTYHFKNSMVQEVALSHLLYRQRQLLQERLDKAR